MNKLSSRLQKAINFYIKDPNWKKALEDAGYSPVTALKKHTELFRKAEPEIRKRQKKVAERANLSAEYIIGKYMDLLENDLSRFIRKDKNGNPYYDFTDATTEDFRVISELTVDKMQKGRGDTAVPVERVRIKEYDKLRILEALGKHLGLFTENVNIKGDISLAERIRAARNNEIMQPRETD